MRLEKFGSVLGLVGIFSGCATTRPLSCEEKCSLSGMGCAGITSQETVTSSFSSLSVGGQFVPIHSIGSATSSGMICLKPSPKEVSSIEK